MTEEEWLAATDPTPMLESLKGKASDRKLRLFAVACCHAIGYMLTDERSRAAIEVAERVAEGLATQRERRETYRTLRGYMDEFAPDEAAAATSHRLPFIAASGAAEWAAVAIGAAADAASSDDDHILVGHRKRCREHARQARLLHDILGNPFRPVALAPAWRTSTAVALAQQMYDSRDFSAMPILADALQDAGCEDEAVLSHCRGEDPHVRGCFVVDLLLGRE